MTRSLPAMHALGAALLLAIASTAGAQDIDHVSKDISIGAGQAAGNLDTVSGDITISRASASAESHDLTEEVQA